MPSKQNDKWTMDDGITASMIAAFLECREQCRLRYLKKLSLAGCTPEYFVYGAMMHNALEMFYRVLGKTTKVTAVNDGLSAICRFEPSHVGRVPPEILNRDAELKRTAMIAAGAYFDHCITAKDKHFQDWKRDWLETEGQFHLPAADHRFGFSLRGMRDGLYRTDGNVLGLLETKNYSRVNEWLMMDGLPANLQTMLYLVALREEYPGQLKFEVMYNVIHRCSLRQYKAESDRDFAKRFRLDMATRPEFYFRRYRYALRKTEIDKWERAVLLPILDAMNDWIIGFDGDFGETARLQDANITNPYHYMSPPALRSQSGSPTSLFQLMVYGHTDPYRARSHAHPELDGET